MNRWQKIVTDLLAGGWTQQSLAAEVNCGQATISDIHNGKTKSPRADLAMALIAVQAKQVRPAVPEGEARL
jgi:transcriptional regulator with XRE-family HTH domain